MNFGIYISTVIADAMIEERKREAAKERRWANALRIKRGLAKTKS